MQGQRSSVEPFPEAFVFEPGSSSASPGPVSLDSQLYWNNMLLNQVDPPEFPQMPYLNEPDQQHPQPEPVASLSLENVGMNINLNANYSDMPSQVQNSDASELRLYPHGHGHGHDSFFGSGSGSLSLNNLASGLGMGLDEDMDTRPGNSALDGRRLACKRKNIEIGAHGQTSASGSTSNSHLHGSGAYSSSSSSYHPYQSPNPGSITTGTNSPSLPLNYLNPAEEPFPGFRIPVTAGGVAGNPQRSFRIRTGPTVGPNLHQDLGAPGLQNPNAWSTLSNTTTTTTNNNTGTDQGSYINNGSANNMRRFNLWGPPPSFQSPVVDTAPHLDPPVMGFGPGHVPPPVSVPTHQFPRNGASSSRVGTASSPIDLESGFAEFTPSPPIGEFVTSGGHRPVHGGASSSVNWDEERERIVSSSSSVRERGGASSSVSPPVGGPAWAPSQGLHSRYHRNLPEEIQGRIGGGPPGLRGQQGPPPPRLRSQYMMERMERHASGEGVWGVPLSLRSREGRRIIEIRNALEFMRRGGDNLRFESIYYGGIEMHDRHRDMRLDIDNMSYEELLALEERIGNVSTGLTEESVAKRLKQHKYSSLNRHISMEEEPCCICQEEYVEGDELGRLDCGHDFHSSCIKQWLTHKNLCPICKNTAL
ncbi:putative E3 ubiquitin-protein ligase HIP1 isoform X2 [Carex rostrata]